MKTNVLFVVFFLILTTSVLADQTIIRPTSQGAYQAWGTVGCSSGSSEWKCVDEIVANTSDRLTASAGKKETFYFSDLNVSNVTINSLQLVYYVRGISAGVNLQPLIRIGTIDYLGLSMNLTTSYATITRNYLTNPSTNTSWTTSEINALQAGAYTIPLAGGAYLAQMYAVVNYTNISEEYFDSCMDTDDYNENVTGNTFGYLNDSFYNSTDYCYDSSTVVEYACDGNISYSSNIYCGAGQQCVSGSCVTLLNTCYDSDGFTITETGNVTGYFNGTYYTEIDFCFDNSTVVEYYCNGTQAISEMNFCDLNMSCLLGRCN